MSDHLLHSGCLRQARCYPAAVAVICGCETLSYGDLLHRAKQVAEQLKANGVRREVIVGVFVDRSLEAAIGFLGVLLAGGAYLPLDPYQPDERLRVILAEANVKTVLFGPGLENRIADEPVTRLSIQAIANNDNVHKEVLPTEYAGDPRDLAYVIFTSGSTGKPKGVLIEHRSAVNTTMDVNERFQVGTCDRVLCLSSFGFDLSVYDLFGLWAAGGAVVIPTPSEATDPSACLRLIREHRVTIWNSVPALLEMMVGYIEDSVSESVGLSPLRLVMLSGDWIPVTLPDRFRRIQPSCEIVSLGGATEASIWSVVYPIGNVDPTWKSIPYGRAMRGQSIHILDDNMRAPAQGNVGEIYIGGIGVARGYVGRADLTAAQFLADPFSRDATTQLYKTGDLGRLLSDGNVEILGRADCQVKISGQRIELGEIEATLTRNPVVREAAVVAASGIGGRKRLVAFIVTGGSGPTSHDLLDFLAQKLPAYMLPSRIHFVASLPLTANGKVDRKQLLDDDAALCRVVLSNRIAGSGTCEKLPAEPVSNLEAELAEIWQVVLERNEISPHDNFFQLGGDSLMAIALAAKLQRRFGWNVTMADLIEFPTIRQLATCLQNGEVEDSLDGSVEINRGSGGPPLFFVPSIFADLFGMRQLALRLPSELPIIGLQPRGIQDGENPDRTIAAITSHYLEQVRRRQPQGPYHLMGFSLGGTVAFEMASRLIELGQEPPLLIMIDAPRHGRTKLVRAGLRLSQFMSQYFTKWLPQGNGMHPLRELPESHARIFEAHHAALCNYRPRPYPAEAYWLRTSQRLGMIKGLIDDFYKTWDWGPLLPLSPFPDWILGSHTTLFEQPNLDGLASRLCATLEAKWPIQSFAKMKSASITVGGNVSSR
jgi:amino acid adenylation domain-containing protein